MQNGNCRSKASDENAHVTSHVRLEAPAGRITAVGTPAQDEGSIKDRRPDAEDLLFVMANQVRVKRSHACHI